MKFLENVQLEFSPHPLAPTFSKEHNPLLLLDQLMSELSSPNFSTSEKVMRLFREAGFVSLWFYLKFILGQEGPYDQLNNKLHLSMCNFRQRVATTPGIKAALFVPRSCLKSTICTHGGGTWELNRDPNLRIGISTAIFPRAESFVTQIIKNISENHLHMELYPELRKANKSNDVLLVTGRTKQHVEPSLQPIAAGGSSQGVHLDLFNPDDIVGDDLLTSERVATADMIRIGDWLHTNKKTLIDDWNKSRVNVLGTRYDINDPYELIMQHSKEQVGLWDDVDYPPDPNGDWITYYLPAKYENESIYPEKLPLDELAKIEQTDPWTYWTQYQNDPHAAKPGEMSSFTIQEVGLEYDPAEEAYYITNGEERIPLQSCDLVMGADPAGNDGVRGRHNSRHAYCVLARDYKNRYFLLSVQRGYWTTVKFIDALFTTKKTYNLLVRMTVLEAQGPFKSWISVIRQEQTIRDEYLNLFPIPALGDKETTIRNIVQPLLERNQIYVVKGRCDCFVQEARSFPGKQMDALDCVKLAIFKSKRPLPPEDRDDDGNYGSRKRKLRGARAGVSPVSGY